MGVFYSSTLSKLTISIISVIEKKFFFIKELYSTENYTQYIAITCMGKKLKKQYIMGFPDDSDGKESALNAGNLGLIRGREDSLEKGIATHSSILAWRIPWTEEPGGL